MRAVQLRVVPTDPLRARTSICAVLPNPCGSTSGSPPAQQSLGQ
jgi:hypothetical protein